MKINDNAAAKNYVRPIFLHVHFYVISHRIKGVKCTNHCAKTVNYPQFLQLWNRKKCVEKFVKHFENNTLQMQTDQTTI